MQRHIFWVPPSGEGPKGQISLNFNYSRFQRFLNQTLCLLTNEIFKTYQTGFLLGCMGHAPGVGLSDTIGGRRGKKMFVFSKFQPDLVCELFT